MEVLVKQHLYNIEYGSSNYKYCKSSNESAAKSRMQEPHDQSPQPPELIASQTGFTKSRAAAQLTWPNSPWSGKISNNTKLRRNPFYPTQYIPPSADQPWKVLSGESGHATPGPKCDIRASSESFELHGNELHLKCQTHWSHSPVRKAALVWICFSIRSVPCSLSAVLKLFLKMFFACGPGTILVQNAPEKRDWQ